ncbi:MAG: hypothetical protein PWQ55_1460 [Chloroflexota bacterium]|nr:hypothetical protein [Chloroflexota bacterium]
MRKTLKTDLFLIIVLVIVAISVQFIFLNPPILSDQMEYYITAVRFPHLPETPNIGSMRIGLELPVAVLYRIFGTSEVAYYTVPLLSAAVLAVSLYLIGKSLFSRRIGFFSGLFITFIPNLIQDAGHLLPDLPATACSAAAFAVLFTYFGDRSHPRDYSARSSRWMFILAGLLFGWSYLVKEYLAILFLLIPLVFWILDIPFRHLIPVALSMLLMYGVEVAVGIIYYHNPLIRFLAASPRETTGEIQKDVNRIVTYFALLLNKESGQGILGLMVLGILNSLVQSFRKQKSHIFLLSWILLIYVLFTFAGLLPVIFKWQDIVLLRLHKFRYWVPILPPLVIGAVAALDAFFVWLKGKLTGLHLSHPAFVSLLLALTLSLAIAPGIHAISNDPDFIRNGADQYLELRSYLKANDNPDAIIWIDRDNKRAFERILPMYVRNPFGKLIWHGSTKYINTDNLYLRADEIDQGYIIVDRDFMTADSALPSYLYDPPAGWQKVFESQNHKLALFKVD